MRGEEPLKAGESGDATFDSPLRNPQYRWLLSSNVAYFMAVHGQAVVRSWLAFQLTGSKLALGKIAAAVALPMLIVAPFGGVIADRVERRLLIHAGQAFVFLAELTLLFLLWTDRLQFWHMVCGTVAMGIAFPVTMPARQAIVVNLVGRQNLTQAMALSIGAMSAMQVVGPLIAGTMIEFTGARGAYTLDVGLYLTAMLCLFGVKRSRAPERVAPKSVAGDILEGLRYLRQDRLLGTLLLFGLVPMFLALPTQQLLVVFAEEVWKVGSSGFGMLQAVSGVGGVAGTLWVARRKGAARLRTMLVAGLAFAGLLALFAVTPWFWVAVVLGLFGYACSSTFGTLNSTSMHLLVDDSIRGRMSSFMMMSMSLPLLGTLPVGALADHYGAPTAVCAACALGALSVLGFWLFSPALRSLDARLAAAQR